MLSLADMEKLRTAYRWHEPVKEAAVLNEIGNPTKAEIVETALANLKSENRNTRVLMLRVLAGQTGKNAVQGILIGLQDKKRRVKEVAIKSCRSFLHHTQITNRLEELALDESEHKRIRQGALQSLAGHYGGTALQVLPAAATRALESLAKNEPQRTEILFRLLMLDLTDPVEMLLRDFVENGSKEEAVTATRALCGYRVIHISEFEGNRSLIKMVEQTCELAAGRTFYWIRRDKFSEMKEQRQQAQQ